MRRILLTLAEDATETECGGCRGLDHVIDWCGPFGVRLVDEIRDSDVPGYRHARCAECVQAEAAAARMVEIAPEDAALDSASLSYPVDEEHDERIRDAWERIENALRAHAAKAEVKR